MVRDLTIRSFGILPARSMPHVSVVLEPSTGPAVNGSDAAFAAVAAARWLADGLLGSWPVDRTGPGRADPTGPTSRPATVEAESGSVGWPSGFPAPPEVQPMTTPIGPYTPVVSAGPWLITSGQLGLAPGGDGPPTLVEGGAPEQLTQALANAGRLLAGHGAGLGRRGQDPVFVTDMGGFAAVNEAYSACFGDHRPARSVVGVAGPADGGGGRGRGVGLLDRREPVGAPA